jgi:large repetitive protein
MNKGRAVLVLLTAASFPALAQITITNPDPLPTGVVTRPYSTTFTRSGGTGTNFNWSTSGTLPPGYSVNSTTGELAGSTTSAGNFQFSVSVFDSFGNSGNRTYNLKINNLLFITTDAFLQGQVGMPFSFGLTATGGENNGPYTWALASSTLPAGLNLNPATGLISGVPLGPPGVFSFSVTATDTAVPTQTTNPVSFDIQILPAPLAIISTSPLPRGIRTLAYAVNLGASGGIPPYSWDLVTGSFPPGITLTPAGALTGTPTQVGNFSFTVQVNDNSESQGASRTFALAVVEPLQISTASPLPSGVAGAPYTTTFAATGGTPPRTGWTVASGNLPPGLTLNPSTATLSGTPTASGSFNFSVQVRDSDSLQQITSKPFSLFIANPPLVITNTSPLPPGRTGVPYSVPLTASGGTPPYTWQLLSGTLPPGVTLSGATLTGTPTATGTYTFTLRVVDSTPPSQSFAGKTDSAAASANNLSADNVFVLQINPGLVITTTGPLPEGEPDAPYIVRFAASGGTTPYAWSIAGGTAPPGLTLSSDGVLSGTVSDIGRFNFTVRVRDAANLTATGEFSISSVRRETRFEIATTSLPDGAAGVFYGATATARGGTSPYSFSISGLPPGVESDSQGGIFGTPTRAGQYNVRVSASDASRGQASATFTITIRPGQVEVTTTAAPDGRVNASYSLTFGARGGVPAYTWGISGGSLPAGLAVSSGGDLTGTPTQTGTFTFTIQATDTEKVSGSKTFTLVIRTGALEITTATLPNGTVNFPYTGTLAAAGGTRPYRWSLGGTVPPGLTVNGETGDISGTPTTAGTFTLTAQVSDADNQNANKNFTLTVAPALVITTTSPLPSLAVNVAGGASFSATGGTQPYVWSLSGTAPPGMSFAAGQLTGTPTATGSYGFTVQVTDANKASTSKAFTLEVVSGLTITTESLPAGTVGAAYSAGLSATGGVVPYHWSGSLPEGLTVDDSGSITGRPTATGTFSVSVQVRDSAQPNASTASRSLSITIAAPELTSVNITGLPDNPAPGQQPRITLDTGSPVPVDINGTVALTFASNAANSADDPAIQFSTGGRSATFTIPAGQNQAVFRTSDVLIQTGTVAGTITITTTLTSGGNPVSCSCALVRTLTIPRTPPVISSVRVNRTANGFSLVITGFSSTREVTRGVFRFSGTANLQTNEVIFPLTDVFNNYFRTSSQVGGQFVLTMPFVIQGESGAVNSVSVILSNAQGDSQAVTATL